MAIQSQAQPQILLTRPAAQSQRFAGALRARFGPELKITISALLAARFLDPLVPAADWTALILTSETAAQSARLLSAQGIKLPKLAFCVGDHTALVAAESGLQTVSAKGDADDLLEVILTQHPSGPLLHLRGQDSRGNLAQRLISAGIETVSVVTYRQEAQPLNAAASALLCGHAPIICPIFSPRSATILGAECIRIAGKAPLTLVALSPAVAAAWTISASPLTIAHRPNAAAMIEAIAMHLESVGKP